MVLAAQLRLPRDGGTDAMANYASLRGPVGLNRVYVQSADAAAGTATEGAAADAEAQRDRWLQGLKAGRSMATNGPLLGFELAGQAPGGELSLPAGSHALTYRGFMRSIVPIDHLEVVLNGAVVATLTPDAAGDSATFSGQLELAESGWVVLRAWNDDGHPDLFDRFAYATTNPVFVTVDDRPVRSAAVADYFIRWIERVRAATEAHPDYLTEAERAAVLATIDAAHAEFLRRR